MRKDLPALFVILVLALAIRLIFVINSDFVIDSDEAIVGIMASDINEGYEIPLFYYGQNYMGNLEALSIALFYKVFPENIIALKLIPLFYSLLLVLCMYFIGAEYDRKVGLLAALLTAVAPSMLIVWSTKSRGGFIEIVLISALSLLAFLRYCKDPKYSRLFYLFLLLGFGWWVNNQIVFYLVPITCLLLWIGVWNLKFPEIIKSILVSFISFILGGLPYWVFNVSNKFESIMHISNSSGEHTSDYFEGLITSAIPIILGAREQWASQDLLPDLGFYITTFIFVLLLFFAAYRSRLIGNFLTGKLQQSYFIAFFILFFTFFVFVSSSFGFLYQSPRYLLPIYVVLNLLIAGSISSMPAAILRVPCVSVILLLNLLSNYPGYIYIPGEPIIAKGDRVGKDNTELSRWLLQQKYYWIRTNYWVGYRLAFETNEQIRFKIFGEPYEARIPRYQVGASSTEFDHLPIVAGMEQSKIIKSALDCMGYVYKTDKVGDYLVLHKISEKYQPQHKISLNDAKLYASHNPDQLDLLRDDKTSTRWGTGEHQQPGEFVSIEFEHARTLTRLGYSLGVFYHDYPRKLKITFESEDGTRSELCDSEGMQAIDFYLKDLEHYTFTFEPKRVKKIIIEQVGADPVFDWSIAELELFE